MTVSNSRLALPGRGLLILWLVLILLAFLGWGVVAQPAGTTPAQAEAGLFGGLLALGLCGGALLIIAPWRDHPASDLPTLWLLVTVVRLLATPMVALLLYFAARPPMEFFVVGCASAFLCVLFFETPLIALDVRRQIVEQEQQRGSERQS